MKSVSTIRTGPDAWLRKTAVFWVAVGALVMSFLLAPQAAFADPEQYTSEFRLGDCTFLTKGVNPYFILLPGYRIVLAGEEDGEAVEAWVTVLKDKESIYLDGIGWIQTRVIEEREWVDDELAEVSRNFYAQCKETGAMYYFGEDVDIYEYDDEGELIGISHEGEWRVGVADAMAGLFMPGTYTLGSRYFQEVAPGIAMDRVEHTGMGLTVITEGGTFTDCVEMTESTPLEPSAHDVKVYCPGIGITIDGPLGLVEAGFVSEGP
jgi:hypothetical protein